MTCSSSPTTAIDRSSPPSSRHPAATSPQANPPDAVHDPPGLIRSCWHRTLVCELVLVSNIQVVSSRADRTRDALQRCALELFLRDGYDATTVAAISRAAGVSQMTFFRHFPTKESVVLDDPYDPVIAEQVAVAGDIAAAGTGSTGIGAG